jgi:hypothetical protein
MKVLFVLFSIIIAFLSTVFKDALAPHLTTITTQLINSTIVTTIRGVPQIKSQEIHKVPESANMTVPRAIRKAFLAIEQSEGVGARVRRSIGTPQLRNFSPFLMLDHFTSSPGSGFPDHPHRYVLTLYKLSQDEHLLTSYPVARRQSLTCCKAQSIMKTSQAMQEQ